MNFKDLSSRLVSILKKYPSLLIYIKGSPDPDVIASSYALSLICGMLGTRSGILASTEPSLPQNKALIDDLGLPIHFSETIHPFRDFDAYAILDYQSRYVKGITEFMPCAVHIDHHKPLPEEPEAEFKLISEEVGATSTILALLLKDLDFMNTCPALEKVVTALFYGIQVDTSDFQYALPVDFEAMDYLIPCANEVILKKITGLPLSGMITKRLGEASRNRVHYREWLITGIGFLEESERDSIAVIADYLMERNDVSLVAVSAVIRRKNGSGLYLDVSLRTKDENLDLDRIIKRITAEGGARRFKGAYQVNLDYLTHYPDQDLLWEVISTSTLEALKKQRDTLRFPELRGLYGRISRRIINIFRRDHK